MSSGFHTYTTNREACSKAGLDEAPDAFYQTALCDALAIQSPQFFFQLNNERDWEKARRPYYNVWPSIVPMLIRLNLNLDSALIQLPLPARCMRLPKQNNPMTFDWRGQAVLDGLETQGDLAAVGVAPVPEQDAKQAQQEQAGSLDPAINQNLPVSLLTDLA